MKKIISAVLLALATTMSLAATDVNKASQADLESISGIGPSMSSRILDERKKSAFKDWSDFTHRVKGIGDSKSKKFSAGGLTVNGAVYDGSAAKGDGKSKGKGGQVKGSPKMAEATSSGPTPTLAKR